MEPKHESHQTSADASRHVTDDILLPDEELRDTRTRDWSPHRIASALDASMDDLAGMIGSEARTIRQVAYGADTHGRLAPFANVLAMM